MVDLPLPQEVADSDYIETESGLKYVDLVPGDTTFPAAEVGQEVVVHYNAWLENGLMVESSIFLVQHPLHSFWVMARSFQDGKKVW